MFSPDASTSASAFVHGAGVMAALIVAIGAQNALVLRQGLLRRHVVPVVLLCVVSDWLLSAAGVFGLGAFIAGEPWLLLAIRLAGAAFLAVYALRSAQRAWRGGAGLAGGRAATAGLGSTLVTAASMTWLNPHVYLDTVVLVGALGSAYPAPIRPAFVAGTGFASLLWFASLGFGAAALAPYLQSSAVWRAIDATMALLMGLLALQLLTAA